MSAASPAQSVLIVEDDPVAAEVLREHLERASPGARVRHELSLAGAVASLDQGWDVILLDLGLPDVDDLQGLQRLRELDQTSAIIVTTANDDDELAVRALEEEAQDYLHKSEINPATLARAMRYAIGRQQTLVRMRQVAAEARAQERNLMEFVRSTSDAIVIVDARGSVSFANAAAEDMLSTKASDLVGRPPAFIDVQQPKAEVEIPSPNGRRLFDVRVVQLEWLGETGRMAVARDVTERRQAEELRAQLHRSERLAAIGKLSAGIAHEVNNPLTYVMGSLEMLQRECGRLEDVPPAQRQRLTTLCESAIEGTERVVNIVRDLSVFSRRDMDDAARPTDLQSVFESALKMVQPQVQHRARVERDFSNVDLVVGHPGRLTQVMVNLLVNAAQSIEEGHVEGNSIRVRTYQQGSRIFASLEDTGSGIDASAMDRLFEPFFTTKAAGEGTGLGLYVCRNIVESYGGDIRVHSEFGKGTRVTIELPVWKGPATETSPHHLHFDSKTPKRARILVVDDEAPIREILVEILSAEHEVVAASSGREAQALLAHDRAFDVVLCDIVMDDISGNQLERWMRERTPELLERLLFMSGGELHGEEVDGVDRLLRKPFRRADVLGQVQAILNA